MDLRWLQGAVIGFFTLAYFFKCNLRQGNILLLTVGWFYFIAHAAVLAFVPHFNPYDFLPAMQDEIAKNSTLILFMLLTYPLVISHIGRRPRGWVIWIFVWALLIDFFIMPFTGWGLLFCWTSFETAMAAILLPFLFEDVPMVWLWMFVGIVAFRGATGLLVAYIGLLAYFAAMGMKKVLAIATVSGLAIIPLVLWWHPHTYPFMGGRLEAWRTYLTMWKNSSNWLFGVGSGALEWIAPFVPVKVENDVLTMNMMHNDWLQILFDTGILGLVFAIAVAGWCLYHLWEKPKFFAMGVSYCAVMCTYFPLHYGIGQIIACILIAEAID